MQTDTAVVRLTLADGERDQAVEAIDAHLELRRSECASQTLEDSGTLAEVRQALCDGTTCEISTVEAVALRTALEERCDELAVDITEAGTETWLARATRCLAEARLALVAVRRSLGEDVDKLAG